MKHKCIECANATLADHPSHAKVGMANCKGLKLSGVFVSINRDDKCDKFKRSTPEIIEKRVQWRNRK